MEFYFTRKNIESLLKQNPKAKGIIVTQEIKVKKTDKGYFNIIEITACADNDHGKMATSEISTRSACVPGCPKPPGCPEEQPDAEI